LVAMAYYSSVFVMGPQMLTLILDCMRESPSSMTACVAFPLL
jgi:hypothetical protein